ncbi:glucosylceramidase [Conyzicola lurida]|uniref:Glucosylceramidase n=1 Tax=Conyzicola lurida TaxID=1172621 RepID=A0A841ALW9_9MICO|nr:glucosylceramidase [Conyzicola lurida]
MTIDTDSARQTVEGFGAALTHSSARLLTEMPAAARSDLLHELFAPDGPTRLSVIRVPLGGSDFVAEPAYTYDDLPAGEEDWDLERFSTSADDDELRPVLREILDISPELRIVASPWSPPAWLKDSGRLDGGRLRDDDRAYSAYAEYLVRAVEESAAAGVPIDYLTVQNEPQARYPDGYPGTDMPVADQVRLIEELGPLLEERAPDARILAYDHNWSLHPADAADGAATDYPAEVLRSGAAQWVAGVAYHCYAGEPTRQSALYDEFPAASVHVTECSGSHAEGDSPEKIFSDTFGFQSRTLLIGSLGNWASTVLTWNVVLDAAGGPHIGGCETCTGVVTAGTDGGFSRNAEYYVLAHAARFVPPGSTAVNTAGDAGSPLSHTAFRTPDGSIVTLVFNDATEARETRVVAGETEATVRLPGRSLVTVVMAPAAAS